MLLFHHPLCPSPTHIPRSRQHPPRTRFATLGSVPLCRQISGEVETIPPLLHQTRKLARLLKVNDLLLPANTALSPHPSPLIAQVSNKAPSTALTSQIAIARSLACFSSLSPFLSIPFPPHSFINSNLLQSISESTTYLQTRCFQTKSFCRQHPISILPTLPPSSEHRAVISSAYKVYYGTAPSLM
jgi:hypothetical protein